MATHGKSGTIYAGGYDLTAYFQSLELAMTAETGETTALGAAAKAFIAGIKDATLSGDGLFDGAANAVDERMDAALGAAATPITVTPAGDSDGNVAYGINAITTQYDVEAPAAEVVSVTMSAQSNVGGERCIVLHALAADGSDNGTTHNNGASSSSGGSAYLHVTASDTPTTFDCDIEGSATGAFAGEETTLASFTQLGAVSVGAERISWTGATAQYIRAKATVVGTSYTYHVSYHRG